MTPLEFDVVACYNKRSGLQQYTYKRIHTVIMLHNSQTAYICCIEFIYTMLVHVNPRSSNHFMNS